MTRRFTRVRWTPLCLLLLVSLFLSACANNSAPPAFEVTEASITDLQAALADGQVTSVDLVDLYIARIAAYDREGPALNTIVRLNPRAREDAQSLDAERASGTVRGPLHGIPVLLKDNYDMAGMPTTGSSLALAGLMPPDDAFQVARLREAGAIFIGKTNLHELAAGITTISSLGGQTRNPYDPTRNPGGSSGGTGAGVAASFATVGWGSDTCGSIRIPASVHSLFGLRPTKGLSSIDGIVPLSHSQDTGGPLARTVMDLAIALDATVGADPADAATEILDGRDLPRFQDVLDAGALTDVRIGVVEPWMEDAQSSVADVLRAALDELAAAGAEVVDVTVPDLDSLLADTGLIDFEFKFDLIEYLAGVPDAPVESLAEIVEAGLHHEALDRTFRRRNLREEADSPELHETLARRDRLRDAVLAFMDTEGLDALAYPTMRNETAVIGEPAQGSTCFLSAHTGLPALTMPAGFTESGLPVGLELLGRPLDDHRLVAAAFAFESLGPKRRPPLRTPPLENGAPPAPTAIVLTSTGAERVPGSVEVGVTGTMELDIPLGLLRYELALTGVDPDDAYATVLRRVNEDGTAVVVLRLSGPGESRPTGSVALGPRLLDELLARRLQLLVRTRRGSELLNIGPLSTPTIEAEP